jgi:hypothetical protein
MILSCCLPPLRRCYGLLIAALLGSMAHLTAQPAPDADDIRDAKPLIEIPSPESSSHSWWIFLAASVAAALVGWWIWKKLRSRTKLASPSAIALTALTELETRREALAADAFADCAAQTLRQYISGRFGLAALRRTTEEFLRELARDENSPLTPHSDHLRGFLKSCDLAKFAGSQLDAAQRSALIDSARGLINATATPTPAVTQP